MVLINPESGAAESFDSQGAAKAIQSGYHVPLNDIQGNPVSLPYTEANEAVGSGTHFQPHPEQLQYLLDQQKYGDAKHQAAAFIQGALDSASGGIGGHLLDKTGITTPESRAMTAEFNPGTHLAGQAAGIVGGVALAPEASVPGLISKAGEAAALGIKAEGMFGTLAKKAVQGAIESGLFTATHEVSEKLLGDSNTTGENIAAHIGINTLLGGGMGLALGPIGIAASKAGKLAEKIPEGVENYLSKAVSEEPAVLSKLLKGEVDGKELITEAAKFYAAPHLFGVKRASDFLKTKAAQYLIDNEPAKESLIKSLAYIAESASNTAKLIDKSAGSLFTLGSDKLTGIDNKDEVTPANEPLKLDRLGTVVKNYTQDPEGLLNHISKNITPISDFAPDTAQSMSASIGSAVNYLNTKLPVEDRQSPLDSPITPSNIEIAKFNRAAKLADDPTHIMTHIKNGTIVPDDIEAISTIYPAVYNNMKSAVFEKLTQYASKNGIDSLPYKTRIGLSMFLGQNLDSTFLPHNIMSNQMVLGVNEMQKQAQQMQQASPSKTGMGKMKSYQNDFTGSQAASARHSQTRSI